MADLKNKFMSGDSIKNISNVRTPMTPGNKYRRIGLLIIGIALIITGIVVWVVSCSTNNTCTLSSIPAAAASVETTAD